MQLVIKEIRALLLMLAIAGILEILVGCEIIDPLILARPSAILQAAWTLSTSADFIGDLLLTAARVAVSVLVGGLIGVSSGIVLGAMPSIYSFIESPLHGLRSIPSSALYPVMILLFGVGNGSAIAMAAIPTALILLIASVAGVKGAHRGRRDLRSILNISSWCYFRHILLWEAMPQISTALRTCVSYALVIIIALELFVGGYTGIGNHLARYQSQYNIARVYATLMIAGFLGYGLNLLVGRLEKRVNHWVGK